MTLGEAAPPWMGRLEHERPEEQSCAELQQSQNLCFRRRHQEERQNPAPDEDV